MDRYFQWVPLIVAVAVVVWGFVTRYRQPAFQVHSCQVSSVLDGDTFQAICDGRLETIRLYCIDAPEMEQRPWGKAARKRLRRLLPRGVRVTLRQYDTDRYDRWVADVFKARENIDRLLVREGRAVVYRKYCDRRQHPEYYADEAEAREAERGVWRRPGLQRTPWLFREQRFFTHSVNSRQSDFRDRDKR